jgi:hypothetical protein
MGLNSHFAVFNFRFAICLPSRPQSGHGYMVPGVHAESRSITPSPRPWVHGARPVPATMMSGKDVSNISNP